MRIKAKIKSAFNKVVKKSNWYNKEMFEDCRKFTTYKTFDTDVVNLGSTSGVHAFNYEGLPIVGANWALGHNPLMGDQAVLKNYFSFLNPKGSTVILSLCPFSSLSGGNENNKDRDYCILHANTIPGFSYKREQKIMSIYQHPLRYIPAYSIWTEIKHLIIPRRVKTLNEEQMEADANRWMEGWLKEFSMKDFSTPLSLLHTDNINSAAAIIDEICDFCKERNIRVVMVVPPMYHTLSEKFTKEARVLLIDSVLERLSNKELPFINYMDDKEFTNDRSLFLDSFFLNKKGAKRFTSKVLNDFGIIK